jgi:uncharacterized protein YdeI (BOF family)
MKATAHLLLVLLCLLIYVPALAQDKADTSSDQPSENQPSENQLTSDQLAKKVVEAAGDPTALEELAFSFVVEKGGEEVVRRRHVWQPKTGTLTVKAADETIELTQINSHDMSKLAADPEANAETWMEIAPESTPEQAAKAWAWFINDSYWLLAPAKLMDPGVNRSLDDQGRLVLTFGEVGLTPGDRYALTVDRDTWQVTRWDFELENGRKGGFEWTDYEKVGRLKVSTRRVADEGGVVIRFDDVEAKP